MSDLQTECERELTESTLHSAHQRITQLEADVAHLQELAAKVLLMELQLVGLADTVADQQRTPLTSPDAQ